jgi:hypothetical protein
LMNERMPANLVESNTEIRNVQWYLVHRNRGSRFRVYANVLPDRGCSDNNHCGSTPPPSPPPTKKRIMNIDKILGYPNRYYMILKVG